MSSFPTDIQRDSMQCGTTCLQMICESYDMRDTVSEQYLAKIGFLGDDYLLLQISEDSNAIYVLILFLF